MPTTKQWRHRISFAKPPVCKPPPPPVPEDLCPQVVPYLDSFLVTSQLKADDGVGIHALTAETWLHRTFGDHWEGTSPAFYFIDPPPPITWDLQIFMDWNSVPCYNGWTYILTPTPGTSVHVGFWEILQNIPSLVPVHFVGQQFAIGAPGSVDAQC